MLSLCASSESLNQSRSPGPTKLRAFARPHVRLFTRSSRWYDGDMDNVKSLTDGAFKSFFDEIIARWDDMSVARKKARATMAQRRGHDLERVTVTGKGVNVRGWFVAFDVGYGDTVSDGCVGFTADGVNLRLPADDGTPGELVTVPYLEPPTNRHVMETCSLNEHRRGLRVGWDHDPDKEEIFDELMKPYWDRYDAERTSPEVRVAADTKTSMDTSHPAASWIPLSLPSLFAPEITRGK